MHIDCKISTCIITPAFIRPILVVHAGDAQAVLAEERGVEQGDWAQLPVPAAHGHLQGHPAGAKEAGRPQAHQASAEGDGQAEQSRQPGHRELSGQTDTAGE